jgi:FtsP/CotA-like multicopper oxidase with cupredoxin domain
VNLSLMNHINADDFNGAIDIAETGKGFCDTARAGDPPAVIYPDPMKETPPNCFHASSTSNLHFHGTHVSPNGLGDNIFVQLRPNLKVTDESVRADFTAIFNAEAPTRWNQLPERWRREQIRLLEEYNKTAPSVDSSGNAKRGLPAELAIPVPKLDQAEFPDFLIGAYPYNFVITPDPAGPNPQKYQMGQVPGTHWYHAHKHGSTATNLYNGLAGAFIIEGDYDDALVKIYPDLKKAEKVLVVQEAKEKPNLERQGGTPNARVVNGDLNPVIEMKQSEIQLWRFINAGVGAPIALSGFTAATAGAPLPVVKPTAQDGLQFNWDNFTKQPLLNFAQNFAPGNRIDWLVQAPSQEGTYTVQVGKTALLTLVVTDEEITPPMQFPTKDNYPKFPTFLADIKDNVKNDRPPLVFGWEDGRTGPGGPPTAPAPHFMINGKQFSGDRPPDEVVKLGDAEVDAGEYNGCNLSSVPHPCESFPGG